MADTSQRVEIRSEQELWDWFEANHTRDEGIWLVTHKKAPGAPFVGRDAVLDALIAYGWIDGRRMKHEDPRLTMQRIAPRKQGIWAQSYKERYARLLAEGRMQPSGRAAYEAAETAGTLDSWKDVDALTVPEDLQAALDALPPASAWFHDAAPSYRRNVLRWLRGAKKPETRAKRAGIIARHAADGRKVPQY